MQIPMEVIVHAVKESAGTIEGRPFSSCTFHCEVDLKENSAGRSIGKVTRPFKLGDAKEFDKWAHLGESLPVKAQALFEMKAARDDKSELVMVAIRPLVQDRPAAAASSKG